MDTKKFEEPTIFIMGSIEELTGQGGANNDDGWYYSPLAVGPGPNW